MNPMMAKPIAVAVAIFWNSFLSGFVHLLTSLSESLENCRRCRDLLELFSIRFRAPFDQPERVLRELPQRLHRRNNLIHFRVL